MERRPRVAVAVVSNIHGNIVARIIVEAGEVGRIGIRRSQYRIGIILDLARINSEDEPDEVPVEIGSIRIRLPLMFNNP